MKILAHAIEQTDAVSAMYGFHRKELSFNAPKKTKNTKEKIRDAT